MNNKQPAYVSQMLAGTEPYGTTAGVETAGIQPAYRAIPGTEPAPPSGIKFEGDLTCVVIRENGKQCKAHRAKGTDFCNGHLLAMEKAARLEGATPSDTEES